VPVVLARSTTFAIDGLEPRRVWVEVDVRAGLPSFAIVGLADAAVRESRERVRAALQNSDFEFPQRRITANLAPAHLRKVGPGFDLALAVAVLAASGQIPAAPLEQVAVFGELSLGGEVRGVHGALAVAEGSGRAGLRGLIVAREHAGEAALVDGLAVAGVQTLAEVADVLSSDGPLPLATPLGDQDLSFTDVPDLRDVRGHGGPRRALEIAAAGAHNLFMQGAPGTGKTMLARRLPSLLPLLRPEEAVEVTRIHSINGTHDGRGLIRQRPFRAPHHTISPSGLVGGGSVPKAGEVTLAHRGVLFLDELPEFSRSSLEALRQPLEDGVSAIVRGQRSLIFPARFMLVAACNPCPCGFAGAKDVDRCRCTETDLARYQRRLSGPLLDRLDLLVSVERPSAEELEGPEPEGSAGVRQRILEARERQAHRYRDEPISCNSELDARGVRRHIQVAPSAWTMLRRSYEQGSLSARGHQRVLRVAQTIADLEGLARVEKPQMLQALSFRGVEPPAERKAA
jgi:magnesium chelatase family protein